MKKTRKHWLLILILLGIALKLRLYQLDAPLADWHSFRQADTASVTREFVNHSYPIWEPHYHDISNIASGLPNPKGYRMVEFPVVNYLVAHILKLNSSWDLVTVSRLTSIAFSLLGITSLYGIVYLVSKRRLLAFLSGLIMAILPYSVFYSRVILPEPAMLGTQLAALWLFIAWAQQPSKTKKKSLVLFFSSWLMLAAGLLIKPTAIFIAPVFGLIALTYLGLGAIFSPWIWFYTLGTLGPMLGWREWIKRYPTGIPASDWLLNGNDIRFRPAWWRWLFGERLSKLILGYWGAGLLSIGLIGRIKTKYNRHSLFDWLTLIWAGSMLGYLAVFATGNVQHDYYQVMLIPIVSILVARGIVWLLEARYMRRLLALALVIFMTGMMLYLSWWEIRGYWQINHPTMVDAGQQVAKVTPPDSLVIAQYQGDTAFLFQTQRRGWPIGTLIEEKIDQGADYYVSLNYDDETNWLLDQYQVVVQNPDYVIIDLNSPKL